MRTIFFIYAVVLAALLGLASSGVASSATADTARGSTGRTILVLGDSLSAGYGIDVRKGWVELLQQRLRAQGYGDRIVNASVSGETTSGGLQRLPRALQVHRPQLVIIELGSNDGLRGLPIATSRTNLDRMVRLAKDAGARVLLLGMKMPPNYGPRYTAEFEATYRDLAKRHQVALVPFLLEGVALRPELIQADGLHPTAAAQTRLLDNVWPSVKRLLDAPAQLPPQARRAI